MIKQIKGERKKKTSDSEEKWKMKLCKIPAWPQP